LDSFQAYTSSDNSLWQSSTLPLAADNVTVSIPAYGVATLYGKSNVVASKAPAGVNRAAIEVYPNPTKGELNLSLPRAKAGEVSIVVSNSLKQTVLKETRMLSSDKQLTLSVAKLPDGYYFLTVTQGGQRFVKPVVVAH
jgi:hypothetical protein